MPRNVPDAILRQLPKNGGVVMVTFVPGFTSPEVVAYEKRAQAEQARLQQTMPSDDAGVNKAMTAWRKANPEPRATLAQVADHIDHIRKVAGIDHIGLGGDFDGITDSGAGPRRRLEVSRAHGGAAEARLFRRRREEDPRPERAARHAPGRARAADLRKQRGPSTATFRDGRPVDDAAPHDQ